MGHLYVASGEGNGWAPLTEAGLRDPHGNDSGVSPPLPPSHSISLSLSWKLLAGTDETNTYLAVRNHLL